MKKIFLIVTVFLSVGILCAFIWPASDFTVDFWFLETNQDRLIHGLEIQSQGPVLCTKDGEMIFYENRTAIINSPASGLGGLAVVCHDDGLFSVYGNLIESTITTKPDLKAAQEIGDPAFNAGGDKGFVFYIIDRVLDGYVNPLLVLPAQKDTMAPIIKGIYLLAAGTEINIGPNDYVSAGKYQVLVSCYDPVGVERSVGVTIPFSTIFELNGKQIQKITLDVLSEKPEGSFAGLSAPVDIELLFDEKGRIHGPLLDINQGKNSFVLRLSDQNGNQTVWRFAINGV